MFFKKKKDEFTSWLKGQFLTLEKGIADSGRQFDELDKKMGQLHAAVQKHDMAIEDLLDVLEENSSDEKERKERFREYEQNECRLLELFEMYQEQFWNLKRFAEKKDDAWSSQMALMEENLKRSLKLCGIHLIQECGTEADYDLYEIIQTIDTEDPRQEGKIAEIYRCGYLYKGKVKKKAQAAAYKRKETQEI